MTREDYWYEIILCSYQPNAFMIKADNYQDAVEKTIDWAVVTYPGMFVQTDTHRIQLKEPGFPRISKIEGWT